MPIAMRLLGSLLLVAVVLPATAGADPASEQPWKDCAQRADVDLRIVGCTRVLADEDEEPADRAVAFNNRGNAHTARGDYTRAIADYTASAKLDPEYVWAYANRGRAHLFTGSLAKARADFQEAAKLDPASPYLALWLDVADRRSKAPSGLGEAVAQFDMAKWPAPILRLYMGETTSEQALAAANGSPDQVCEANFYSGELALAQGNKGEALRLFRAAVSGCATGLIEGMGAKAELRALGVKQ